MRLRVLFVLLSSFFYSGAETCQADGGREKRDIQHLYPSERCTDAAAEVKRSPSFAALCRDAASEHGTRRGGGGKSAIYRPTDPCLLYHARIWRESASARCCSVLPEAREIRGESQDRFQRAERGVAEAM